MLLGNSKMKTTFLIYLLEWDPGLAELNSKKLPKWDTLLTRPSGKWLDCPGKEGSQQ